MQDPHLPPHLLERLQTLGQVLLLVIRGDHHADAGLAARDGRECDRHREQAPVEESSHSWGAAFRSEEMLSSRKGRYNQRD